MTLIYWAYSTCCSIKYEKKNWGIEVPVAHVVLAVLSNFLIICQEMALGTALKSDQLEYSCLHHLIDIPFRRRLSGGSLRYWCHRMRGCSDPYRMGLHNVENSYTGISIFWGYVLIRSIGLALQKVVIEDRSRSDNTRCITYVPLCCKDPMGDIRPIGQLKPAPLAFLWPTPVVGLLSRELGNLMWHVRVVFVIYCIIMYYLV